MSFWGYNGISIISFRRKLSEAGFDPNVSLTSEELEKVKYLFRQCVTSNTLIVFRNIQINTLRMHIVKVDPKLFLARKE